MKEIKKIEVTDYHPLWPEQFEKESAQIKKVLGECCVAVHHVGSTSVPGLAAKPKIDIIVVVNNHPAESIKKLEELHYEYRGEYNIPLHFGFSKRDQLKANLHLYQEGNPEIELNLVFRDYLRSHPKVRDEYAALKYKLLQDKSSFEKNNSILTGYNLGKDAFIRKVLKKAGFNRLRFVKCTHYAEWEGARRLRQSTFHEISDPFEWTFNHPDHTHFILYHGVEIVGYAHVELAHSQAFLRMIVMENDDFKKQFLAWIETWLKWQGIEGLRKESLS